MAKHPTSSRVHRGEEVPDDAFVSTIRRITAWSRENSRELIIAAVILAVLAVAAVWYVNQQRSVEAQAAARFGAVQQSIASGNTQLAIRDLESFIATFGETDAGDRARLLLADLLIGEDRTQDALQALGSLPDELDQPFGLAAARLKAAALERVGEADQAVDAYLAVADNARFEYQRREALADAARVQMQNGDPDAAAALYQRILDTFEEQESGRGYYEMWLAEARAMAKQGTGTAPVAPADDTAATDSVSA